MGTGRYGEVERHPPDRRDVGVDVVVTRGCDNEPVGDEGRDVPGIVFVRGRDEKEEYREQQRHAFESVRVVVFHAFYERCQFGGTERVMGERREEVLVSCVLLDRSSLNGTSSSSGSSACCSIWLFMMFF